MTDDIQARGWEICRLFGAIFLGFILLQIGGWLFYTGMIPLTAIKPDEFVKNNYGPAALIVFWASSIAAAIWWAIAVFYFRPKFYPKEDTSIGQLIWWVIFIFTICIAGLSLHSYGKTIPEAIPSMLGSLVIIMAINFWLATAVSTPLLLTYVVPGAQWLQRFLRIN